MCWLVCGLPWYRLGYLLDFGHLLCSAIATTRTWHRETETMMELAHHRGLGDMGTTSKDNKSHLELAYSIFHPICDVCSLRQIHG